VSFSAGALLGDVFIHLLPETIETGFTLASSLYILLGILFSFVIEKIIHWRHCHHSPTHNHPHPFALMNLVGDVFHNFLDGIIIGVSYLASIPVGIATTLAVVFHEIPQEIGDFGVLLHGGFKKSKALFLNFLTALTAILGAVIALLLSSSIQNLTTYLIPFTIGNFIYIASSDLIPELHKCEFNTKQSFLQLATIILGILVMLTLTFLE
jgi:zinc and cadmium transporter